jgi:hypothetical protein
LNSGIGEGNWTANNMHSFIDLLTGSRVTFPTKF